MSTHNANSMTLKLYVLGDRSTREAVLEKINSTLQELIGDDYRLEVIDLEEHPESAEEAQILAIPTLIKEQPRPTVRLIGDLSSSDSLRGHLI